MYNDFLIKKLLYFSIIVVMIIAFNLVPSYAEAEQAPIKVGFFELEGFNDIDEEGNLSGYGYEYLMEISKYTGWKYDFISFIGNKNDKHRLTYNEALDLIKNGKIDIMGSIPKTSKASNLYLYPTFPYATNYGCLTKSCNNTLYNPNDFSSINGATIGILKNDPRNKEIELYLKENKVYDYTLKTYETTSELKEALIQGYVDLIYLNNFRSMENEQILARINPTPYYFVMSKNNNDKIENLSCALEQIDINFPLFSKNLLVKYYQSSFKTQLSLTSEELDFIKSNPVIKIAYDPYFNPLEYYDKEKEKVCGVTVDLLDIINKETGLNFSFVESNSYNLALQDAKKNNINIITAFGADYNWARKHDCRLTTSYFSLPVSAVCNKNINDPEDKDLTVAVVKGYYLTEKIKKEKGYSNFIYYDTLEQCLNSVDNELSDITFLSTYSADYYLSLSRYSNLSMYASYDLNYNLSLAVTNSSSDILYTIINKALINIPQDEIDEIFYKNILFYKNNKTLSDFILEHPFELISIACFIGTLILAGIIFIKNTKKDIKQQKYLNEEKINLALMHTSTYVWDYDFINKKIIQSSSKKIFGKEKIIYDVPESLIRSEYIHEDSKEEFSKLFHNIQGAEQIVSGVFKISPYENSQVCNKEYLWIKITLTKIYSSNGKPLRAVGVSEDVSSEMAFKEKATKDPLTSLLNRATFRQYTVQYLAEHSDEDKGAMFLIDIDNFKLVNDNHGHCSGDELLLRVAKTLRSNFRADDLICRLGGDEFTVFMKNVNSKEEVKKKATSLSKSLVLNLDDFTSTCSIGVVMKKANSKYEDLYWNADRAMYQAKKKGKNQWYLIS